MDFTLALFCLQNKELKQKRNTERMVLKLLFVLQGKLNNYKDMTVILVQTHKMLRDFDQYFHV
jgi:hypothetical protein